jgi:hypothetical protein
MARPQRRSSNQEFILYQPKQEETPCGWAIHGRCSREHGDKLVFSGSAVEVHDQFGHHYAFQLLDRPAKPTVKNGAVDAPPTATLLTPREADLVAGRHFKHGKSRTARMTEIQRLSRLHPLTRKPLPAEDAVERAEAKFEILGKERLPLSVRTVSPALFAAEALRVEGIAIAVD